MPKPKPKQTATLVPKPKPTIVKATTTIKKIVKPLTPKPAKPKPAAAAGSASSAPAKPVSKPVVKPVKRPVPSKSSTSSNSSSDDDDDVGSSSATSSEDDDESDVDEPAPRPRPPPSILQPPPVVGVVIPSTAYLALERLKTSLASLDEHSAPIFAQNSVLEAKQAMRSHENVFEQLQSQATISNSSVTGLLTAAATAATAAVAAVRAATTTNIDTEIAAFRRTARTLHQTWSTLLPQVEELAAAAQQQQDAAFKVSRVASGILGAHSALASTVASALDGIKDHTP